MQSNCISISSIASSESVRPCQPFVKTSLQRKAKRLLGCQIFDFSTPQRRVLRERSSRLSIPCPSSWQFRNNVADPAHHGESFPIADSEIILNYPTKANPP
jgi:hypothetical protein